jgi:hypothetical protein
VQQQALQMLTLAQRTAEEHVAGAQRYADKLQEDARAAAEQIIQDAQGQAEAIQAQIRYEETVGKLAARREALQQQIEALQDFDRDYRSHLLGFIQAHVRALWVDLPVVEADIIEQQPTTDVRPVLLESRRSNGSEAPRSIARGV